MKLLFEKSSCVYENLSGCLFNVLCAFFFFPFIVSDAFSWSLGICEVANQRERKSLIWNMR